jgi:hypothetical protein
MEAEYQACGVVEREEVSLAKATQDLVRMSLDFPLSGLVVGACDNKAALCVPPSQHRSKHIDSVHNFVKDQVISGHLKFVYCNLNSKRTVVIA